MPKVSNEHQEARRAQIIEAAIQCFSKKGFHQTSMQDIVLESGLSPGAIYLYFKGKEDIIRAIADKQHSKERDLIAKACSSSDVKIALGQLVKSFFEPLSDSEVFENRRIGVQLWTEALSNPIVYEVVRSGIDEPLRELTKLISEFQEQGSIQAGLAPDAIARVMVALYQGFILQLVWDEQVNVGEYVTAAEAIISTFFQA